MEEVHGSCSSVLSLFSRCRAFMLQMGRAVSPKGLNESVSTNLSNGHKLHEWERSEFLPWLWEKPPALQESHCYFHPWFLRHSWRTLSNDRRTPGRRCAMSGSFLVRRRFSKAWIHFRNHQYLLNILTLMEAGQVWPQKAQKLVYFGMCLEGDRSWFLWHRHRHRCPLLRLWKMKGIILQWELSRHTWRSIWRHLWFNQATTIPPLGPLLLIMSTLSQYV